MITKGDTIRFEAGRPRWWNLLGWWRWWRRPKLGGFYRVVSVSNVTLKLREKP